MDIADIMFHVPESLDPRELANIETDLQGCDGVVSAHFGHGHPHMLEVAYNPEAITSATLRSHLLERGLKATMVGI